MHQILKMTLQQQVIRAVYIDQNDSLRNLSMYDNDITVTKNVSTTIGLEIRRVDRKILKLSQDKIFFLNVVSNDGEEYILRKEFEMFNLEKGQLKVTIDPDDIAVTKTGRYNFSVSYIENEQEILLNTQSNSKTYGDFNIEDKSMPNTKPPFIQIEFTRVRTNRDAQTVLQTDKDTFISSRLPIIKNIHTATVDITNFKGRIIVQATKNIDPTDQVSFVDISEVEYDNETGNQLFELTTQEDHKFYRFRFITAVDNEGTIDGLTYM